MDERAEAVDDPLDIPHEVADQHRAAAELPAIALIPQPRLVWSEAWHAEVEHLGTRHRAFQLDGPAIDLRRLAAVRERVAERRDPPQTRPA